MHTRPWGRLDDGRPVTAVTVGSDLISLTVLDWGATVHALDVGGRNVVLGHPDLATYLRSPHYFGATIGRYPNRIAGGRFVVDGVSCQVPRNDGANNLHGGPAGFDRQVWEVASASPSYVELRLVEPEGNQGFPGSVTASVRFSVTGATVAVDYEATTTAPTPFGMTQHAYFNLSGWGTVLDHTLRLAAPAYTPVGADGILTGEVAPVEGSAFDWRADRALRTMLPSLDSGLDHNFVLAGAGLREVAWLQSPDAPGLTVATDQPGLQVYTGGKIDGSLPGTSGSAYEPFAGVALETQPFPDSPNQPSFPAVILRPGQVYRSRTEWRFSGG